MSFSPTTLDGLLRSKAVELPQKLAYVFLKDGKIEDEAWTYSELDRRARAIGAKLQQDQAVGERALLLYPQGLDFLAAFFGSLYAGVIGVPAPAPEASRLKRALPRLQAIVRDAEATIVLASPQIISMLKDFTGQIPEFQRMRWIPTTEVPMELGEAWQDRDVSPNDLAYPAIHFWLNILAQWGDDQP